MGNLSNLTEIEHWVTKVNGKGEYSTGTTYEEASKGDWFPGIKQVIRIERAAE